MSRKTAKKEKDKLYADIKEIKQALYKNDSSIQELRSSIALKALKDKTRDKILKDNADICSGYVQSVTANAKSEAHHSFMIGVMVGAMAVMVLLTLISLFA